MCRSKGWEVEEVLEGGGGAGSRLSLCEEGKPSQLALGGTLMAVLPNRHDVMCSSDLQVDMFGTVKALGQCLQQVRVWGSPEETCLR